MLRGATNTIAATTTISTGRLCRVSAVSTGRTEVMLFGRWKEETLVAGWTMATLVTSWIEATLVAGWGLTVESVPLPRLQGYLPRRRLRAHHSDFPTIHVHPFTTWSQLVALSRQATISGYRIATLNFGAEDKAEVARAETVGSASKYGDDPGTTSVVLKTSRKLESKYDELPGFCGINKSWTDGTGDARCKILPKSEGQSTGRFGVDQTRASNAMVHVHMRIWRR
jgi:hypothetical protein